MQYVISNARQIINAKRKAGMSRQRGATLVEIILYLAVAAIVIFAVFSLFGNAFGGGKSQSEVSNIQGIISGVNSIYGTQRVYGTGNLVPSLIKTKAAPSSMVVAGQGDSLRNTFGGLVTVTGGDYQYAITTASIPARACVELAQANFGTVSFTINGAGLANPATASDATAACSQDNNTLAWIVR